MGDYYLFSDKVYNDGEWETKYLQVKGSKFARVRGDKPKGRELNVSTFWVGPGRAFVDMQDPLYNRVDKEDAVNKYIFCGCTLLLCQLPINSKRRHKQYFTQFKKDLAWMPVDYMVVPKIPLWILDAEHIVYFGRKKVPFIMLDVENIDDLMDVKWGWIQNAQTFSGVPITYNASKIDDKEELKKVWTWICSNYDIQTVEEEITESSLSKATLRQTGISPQKGDLLLNSSADFNLYKNERSTPIDDPTKFSYDKAIPEITVMKGKIIKSNKVIKGKPGDGKYCQITIPNQLNTNY